jgi:hypothetical protein
MALDPFNTILLVLFLGVIALFALAWLVFNPVDGARYLELDLVEAGRPTSESRSRDATRVSPGGQYGRLAADALSASTIAVRRPGAADHMGAFERQVRAIVIQTLRDTGHAPTAASIGERTSERGFVVARGSHRNTQGAQ